MLAQGVQNHHLVQGMHLLQLLLPKGGDLADVETRPPAACQGAPQCRRRQAPDRTCGRGPGPPRSVELQRAVGVHAQPPLRKPAAAHAAQRVPLAASERVPLAVRLASPRWLRLRPLPALALLHVLHRGRLSERLRRRAGDVGGRRLEGGRRGCPPRPLRSAAAAAAGRGSGRWQLRERLPEDDRGGGLALARAAPRPRPLAGGSDDVAAFAAADHGHLGLWHRGLGLA
mmetsp:Transcript_89632/g.225427  ORF Transcript_89632/g.225427 Transcript_89632/m.225427 type:complete len:229 (+) Transcript_89632:251-937(+)